MIMPNAVRGRLGALNFVNVSTEDWDARPRRVRAQPAPLPRHAGPRDGPLHGPPPSLRRHLGRRTTTSTATTASTSPSRCPTPRDASDFNQLDGEAGLQLGGAGGSSRPTTTRRKEPPRARRHRPVDDQQLGHGLHAELVPAHSTVPAATTKWRSAYGYGDLVDIYDNNRARGRQLARPPLVGRGQINSDQHPPRTYIKWYVGGETCNVRRGLPVQHLERLPLRRAALESNTRLAGLVADL